MQRTLKVAFIGAGQVNFGSPWVPWDHASRLEKICDVSVTAIVEPFTERAKEQLARRRDSKFAHVYADCVIYSTVQELLDTQVPDVVIVGVPPGCRGSLEEGKDIELRCLKAGVHVFAEKPLSVAPPEEFNKYLEAVEQEQKRQNLVFSVGYMFRYHAAVLKMRQLIKAHGGKVMAFSGRYHLAYMEVLAKPHWWDKTQTGGPIVEQATHFCDLARFLAGDVDEASIKTTCLKETDPGGAGIISKALPMEKTIAPKERIPRVTMSHWRFAEGGIGCLTHTVALHGVRYEAAIDVHLDGLKLTLNDPYRDKCTLTVRDGKSDNPDEDIIFRFEDNDPYRNELESFLTAVRTGDSSQIQSTYSDAAKTYSLTWAIRRSGE